MSIQVHGQVQSTALAVPSQRLSAVVLAMTLGVALVFLSGFAAPAVVHNAAHDWRHAHNFPCH
jgi:cobalt transporter subunit CbtB